MCKSEKSGVHRFLIYVTTHESPLQYLSGHNHGPTKEALQGGARGFVAKPFDMGQLLQTVHKVLDEM
jgi:hypothetical protein